MKLKTLFKRQMQKSQLVLGLSLILLFFSAVLTSKMLSKTNLFPSASKRHDIEKIQIATWNNICANLKTVSDFESCLKQPTSDLAWTTVSIPGLSDIHKNGRPNFEKLLQRQASSLASRIFEEGDNFVLRIDLPSNLFTTDLHSHELNELVFSHVRNAVVCIESNCRHAFNYTTWGLNSVPLSKVSPNTSSVYIFGSHVDWNYAISLQNGIFVSKSRDLWAAKRFYNLYLNAEIIIFILAFSGVLFFLIWSAFIWKDYQDYAHLLYFGASFVFVAIVDRHLSMSWSGEDLFMQFFLRSAAWLNAYLAMQSFAIATLRLNAFLRRIIGLCTALVLACLVVYFSTTFENTQHLYSANTKIQLIFSTLSSVVPISICFIGLVICWRLKHQSEHSGQMGQIEFTHRIWQQGLYCLGLLLFNWASSENMIAMLSNSRPTSVFTPLSAAAFILIFIVTLRPSMLRLKRAVDLTDRDCEAAAMKLLLPSKNYFEWKSKERSAVFIEADIKGSTGAITDLNQSMHSIMKILRQILQEDIKLEGCSILLAKPLGDAWIFVITPKRDEKLSDLLTKLASLCRSQKPKYDAILKTTQSVLLKNNKKIRGKDLKIGIHLRLFACDSFYLQDRLEPKMESLSRVLKDFYNIKVNLRTTRDTELDFIGENSHLFLRYLPKAEEGQISVGASRAVLETISQGSMPLYKAIPSQQDSHSYLKDNNIDLYYTYIHQDEDDDENIPRKLA